MEAGRSFEDFYRAEWAGVRRAVGFTVGDGDVARECVDEAMTRAYERWDQVAAMDRPAGWVYRVAVNLARNRARHRRVERARQPAAGPATAPGADDVADPALAAALARLPDGPAVGRRAAVLPRLVGRGRGRRRSTSRRAPSRAACTGRCAVSNPSSGSREHERRERAGCRAAPAGALRRPGRPRAARRARPRARDGRRPGPPGGRPAPAADLRPAPPLVPPGGGRRPGRRLPAGRGGGGGDRRRRLRPDRHRPPRAHGADHRAPGPHHACPSPPRPRPRRAPRWWPPRPRAAR